MANQTYPLQPIQKQQVQRLSELSIHCVMPMVQSTTLSNIKIPLAGNIPKCENASSALQRNVSAEMLDSIASLVVKPLACATYVKTEIVFVIMW
jgi:hypothetical protein